MYIHSVHHVCTLVNDCGEDPRHWIIYLITFIANCAVYGWALSPMFTGEQLEVRLHGGLTMDPNTFTGRYLICFVFLLASIFTTLTVFRVLTNRRLKQQRETVRALTSSAIELSPKELLSVSSSTASEGGSDTSPGVHRDLHPPQRHQGYVLCRPVYTRPPSHSPTPHRTWKWRRLRGLQAW